MSLPRRTAQQGYAGPGPRSKARLRLIVERAARASMIAPGTTRWSSRSRIRSAAEIFEEDELMKRVSQSQAARCEPLAHQARPGDLTSGRWRGARSGEVRPFGRMR
jgi:hypothetical protein